MIHLLVSLRVSLVLVFSMIFGLFFFTSSAFCMQTTIAWDANSENDLAGYKVYIGLSPGVYTSTTDVGLNTQLDLSSFPAGNTYFVAVTAYNFAGNESPPSEEVFVSIEAQGNGNTSPVATNDSHRTSKDVTLWVPLVRGLLLNDRDPDGDPLTVDTTPVNGTDHGQLTLLANGTFQFISDPGFSGTDSFVYSIHDGQGGTAQATVTLTVTPNGGGSNTAPVAANDSHSTLKDVTLWVPLWRGLLLNDTDPDGDSLTVDITPVDSTDHGQLTLLANGTFQYIPDPRFSGTDSFIYAIHDGQGGTDQATVTLTVTSNGGSNAPPVANNDNYTTSKDVTLWVPLGLGLLLNDQDPNGDPLSVNLTPANDTSHGELTLLANGTFQYLPVPDFSGTDSFIYQLRDGHGGTDLATVTITVSSD